jgi:N-acetyl-anhydromuramyl-L-alanine amidase AmpD
MIHAMAEYIFYKGKMWPYADLLKSLGRGAHFAILTDGQIIQHAPLSSMMWHARGFNRKSWGVELIVPGVYDLAGLYREIDRETMAFDVYTRQQYHGIKNLMVFIASHGYIENPKEDWGTHSAHSQGRKKDPGNAFDIGHLKEVLDGHFI